MNWYKLSQNAQAISQIAAGVRQSILNTKDDDTLQELCLPVSRHLAKVFIDNGYAAANVVQGTFTIDHPDPLATEGWDIADFGYDEEMMKQASFTPLHYWVQINNIVIDITADQFNDELDGTFPDVIVGEIGSLGRYTVITEDFIEPKTMY